MSFNSLKRVYDALRVGMPGIQQKAIIDALGPELVVVKQATETVASSTTLQADDELAVEVEAGKSYHLELWLPIAIAAAANGIKLDLAGGSCSVHSIVGRANFSITGAAGLKTAIAALNTSLDGGAATAWTELTIDAYMRVNVGGELRLQFAQSVSGATNTQILAGAIMRAKPIVLKGATER